MAQNNIFKAYLDMVEAMEWTSFVVIYEEPEGLIRLLRYCAKS